MGEITWDTPPTEEELNGQSEATWDTPPTKAELNSVDNTVTPPKAEGGVVDYLFNPKEETKDTDAFRQGQASVNEPNVEAPVPTEAPNMEGHGAVMTGFLGRKYSVDEVNSFMQYQMSQGKTKNEALGELKKIEGAAPLDLLNASRYGSIVAAPSEAADKIVGLDPAKKGLARVGMVVAQTSVDIASSIGVDTTEKQEALDFAKGQLQAETKQMEDTFGMVSPIETMVRYTPEMLSFGIAGGAKTVFALESTLEYGLSRADGFSKGQSLTRAVTVGIIAGGAEKLVSGPAVVNKNGLTDEAETVLDYMQVKQGTEQFDELKASLKDVAPEDQARVLAEQGGITTEGMFNQALKNVDDKTKAKYAQLLAEKRKEFAEATGLDDFAGIEKATKEQYQIMRQAVRDMSLDQTYNVDVLAKELEGFLPYARNDQAANKIMRMVEQIKDKPTKSLDEIIDLRQEINFEYGRTTNQTAKAMLNKMRKNVDGYLKHSELPPEIYTMMEDSIASYNRMKSQGEILELLNKNTITKGQGSAIGEVKVTNWGKLAEDVKEAGLGKVVEDEIALIDKMSKKFGSTHTDLLGGTRAKGATTGLDDMPSALLAAHTGSTKVPLFKKIEDILVAHLPTESGKAMRAQNAIANSMEKSRNYKEFAENLIKEKNIPANIKAKTQTMLDEAAEAVAESRKAPATKAESQKIIAKAEKMKLGVDKAEIAARTAKRNLDNAHSRTAKLEQAIDEANVAGDFERVDQLSEALDKHNKTTVKIAEQRYDTARRTHSTAKEAYDKYAERYSAAFENTPPFETGLKGSERPPRTNSGKGDKPTPANEEPPTFVSAGVALEEAGIQSAGTTKQDTSAMSQIDSFMKAGIK